MKAVIPREDDGIVAFSPEFDIASQGNGIQGVRDRLGIRLELFYECASPAEIKGLPGDDVGVTLVEVSVGSTRSVGVMRLAGAGRGWSPRARTKGKRQ